MLAVQGLAVALYAGTLLHPPVWDDIAQVVYQPFLQSCSNLALLLNPRYLFWVLPVENAARPAWLASVLLDRCLFGNIFLGHRITNLLWHSAGAVLVLGLAWEWTRRRRTAVLAGLLFAAHPLHTEAVNLVSFRTDLMAFVFMAASLLAYRLARHAPKPLKSPWLWGTLGCFVLALLSKETALTLPVLLVLSDRLVPAAPPESIGIGARARTPKASAVYHRNAHFKTLGIYGSLAVIAFGYLVFRAPRSGYVLGEHQDLFTQLKNQTSWPTGKIAPEFEYSAPGDKVAPDPMPWQEVYERPAVRFLTMSKVFGSYLRLLLWPHPLQADYSIVPIHRWTDGRVLLSWIAWSAWLACAWRLRKRSPAAAMGMLWVPVSLLPVSGIVAIRNLQAERYLYVASAGFCVAAAAMLTEIASWLSKKTGWSLYPVEVIIWGIGLGIVCVYGTATILRNRDYKDNFTLYQSILREDPSVARAHINLGGLYQLQRRWPQAETEYREALRLWPTLTQGRVLLAQLLQLQGKMEEAAATLREGLDGSPRDKRLRYYLQRLPGEHNSRTRRK